MTQNKLALLAKESIHLESLLSGPPAEPNYSPETTYEKAMEGQTQATQHDREVRHYRVKVNHQNRLQKLPRPEFSVATNHGNFATKKQHHSDKEYHF